MGEIIKQLLTYAVMAPSGDNSQPWRFVIEENVLFVYNIPEKDNPYLNVGQSGSYIAHGALLKNILITAPVFGLVADIQIAREDLDPLIATISFSPGPKETNPLFEYIPKRHTNRRVYDKKVLPVLPVVDGLHYLTKKEDVEEVASCGSAAEIVILENEALHGALFKDIVWNTKTERRVRHGLFIATMEFNPVQKALFWLAQFPWVMRIARAIAFPRFIAKEDATLYASGGVMGVLTVTEKTKQGFIDLGMRLQEVWLASTKEGYAFQPITAIFFLEYKVQNDSKFLSKEHVTLVDRSYKKIRQLFSIPEEEFPFIMFRIGYAPPASGRSSRQSPAISYTR